MFRMIVKPFNFLKTTYSVAIWAVFLLFSIATAQAASVSLAWNSVANAGGYILSYGQVSQSGQANPSYTNNVDVGNKTTSSPITVQEGVTYYFAVKAYDTAKTVQSAYSTELPYTVPSTAPVASISATPLSGPAPLAVTFTGNATGSVTTWAWNFGDGTSGSGKTVSHSYSSAGTYTATLTATGSGGSNSATTTITVTAPTVAAPVASVSATPTSGQVPLTVTFSGKWTGSATKQTWDFGDGSATTSSTSTASSVSAVKTYNTPGTYTAKFTATGTGGSHTVTQTITATTKVPTASFSASATTGTAPLTVQFTDASTPTSAITSWAWTFGDSSSTSNTSTAQSPSHTYNGAGTYTVSLKATNSAGTSSPKTGTITVSAATSTSGGLVAAYSFDEASGATVADASSKGNHGTISGATRTTSGKYGKALSFDGLNDWVTVNHSVSLNLTTGMTLEAWVYPTATMSGWQSILTKEQPGSYVYMLYANSDANVPATAALFNNNEGALWGSSPLIPNTWVHLATTYDGAVQRFYVNSTEVANRLRPGSIGVSDGVLRIGGNSVWGEFFKGCIDEIRIYNRALTANEIKTDMNTTVAKSSPPKLLLGSQTVGSLADSAVQGIAAAFQTTASVTGQVTSLPVYVDTGSTSTQLAVGIYTNNNGHPGALLAKGTLSSPKAAAWNQVPLPTTAVTANTTYWVAILSPKGKGDLKFRDKVGSTVLPSETSKTTTLTTLPSTWTTGTISSNGPLSGYGAGY